MIYIAFLRAINVGGHVVKMDDLRRIFESFGFKNVETYIQSGNVIFETSTTNKKTLTQKIEKGLNKELGYEVATFLRTKEEMRALVKYDPFKTIKASDKAKTYVTFLHQTSEVLRKTSEVLGKKVPVFSRKKDVEVIGVRECDVFCLSHLVDGSFGFPNLFLEKELKTPATTRNWTTVSKMAE
ncbi:MAG: DUF1697 domain-containing protein [Chloroflexi bacterium]|nr:DUF1697 domain-containing protein [Chloroflexota bacterium]MBI5715693.1 DUF1697 domain-containing protein [Chloroflexota bacterium]